MAVSRNEVKDKIQKIGVNKWYLNGCRGTLALATGVGKSRCGVLASQWLVGFRPDARILILTPTQTIRDGWRDEFKKWGSEDIFTYNVGCECIQTAYKHVDREYDFVICDEVHNYLSSGEEYEYFKFFENNTIHRILGLSATIDKDLLPRLNTIAPIVYSIDTAKAVELGLISPFTIYNIPVELTSYEKNKYDVIDSEFHSTFQLFNRDLNLMFKCLKDKAFFQRHLINRFGLNIYNRQEIDETVKKYESYPYRCNKAMRERKEIIYSAENKINAIVEISKMFGKRNGVIFSQTAKSADKISSLVGDICVSEHSGIKPKKKRTENLRKYGDRRTKVRRISAVKSLNEGANLPGTDFIIVGSGTSKLGTFLQRVGRAVRFEEGKQADIIRVYVRDSQEEKWLQSSQEGYEVTELLNYKFLEPYVNEKLKTDD